MTWKNVYKPVKRAIKTQESSITLPGRDWSWKERRQTTLERKLLDCLFYEMIFITEKKPILNTQWDYIRTKPFLELIMFLIARTKHVTFVLCFFFSVTLNCVNYVTFLFFHLLSCHLIMMSAISKRGVKLFSLFLSYEISRKINAVEN